jgi:PAS domain S-box-containing protein
MPASPNVLPLRPAEAHIAPDFQALVEAAGDLIYTLDLQGRFTYYNRAATVVLGYAPGATSMLGVSFLTILTPESAAVAQKHFAQAVSGHEPTPFFEIEARHQDGSIVNLEVRSGPVLRAGIVVGRQGIARNITEIKSLQAQVTAKSQRMTLLEERMRLAMGLYGRIADLVHGDSGGSVSSDEALVVVEDTLKHLSAERHGMAALDISVLKLLAQGRSNEDIARHICRSPHTVKDMVKRIMLRLGAKRRAEAVACAIRLGLISAA